MEPRPRQPDSPQPRTGVGRDLQRLKTDGHASAAEVRDFFARMKGKSPQEMLGVVAQSGLAMSILWSTLGTLALLFVCTIVPYAMKDSQANGKQTAAKKKDSGAPATPPKAANVATNGNQPATESPTDVAKKLGHNEVKTGSPPNLDNLLDRKP